MDDTVPSPASKAFIERLRKYAFDPTPATLTSTSTSGPASTPSSSRSGAQAIKNGVTVGNEQQNGPRRSSRKRSRPTSTTKAAELSSSSRIGNKSKGNGSKRMRASARDSFDDLDSWSDRSDVQGDSSIDPSKNDRARGEDAKPATQALGLEEDEEEIKEVELKDQLEARSAQPRIDAAEESDTIAQASPIKKPGKKPRPFAGPETYAHLNPVQDLLLPDLDCEYWAIPVATDDSYVKCLLI